MPIRTILFLFFSMMACLSSAQEDSTTNLDFEEMFMPSRFYRFNQPAKDFMLMPDSIGYAHPTTQAQLKFVMSFPVTFERTLDDYRKPDTTNQSILIDTIYTQSKLGRTFIKITEAIAPKNSGYDNVILFMVAVDQGASTLGLVGAYPKSKDKEWRKNFLAAILSVRKI